MNQIARRAQRRHPLVLLGTLLILSACTDSTQSVALQEPSETKSAPAKFLPYGRPIPESEAVTLPPEPYDARRHGPLLPNTQPEANVLGTPGYEFLSTLSSTPRATPRSAANTTGGLFAFDDAFGTVEGVEWTPSPLIQWYGIQVTHEVLPSSYSLPSGGSSGGSVALSLRLQSYPAGQSCLQASTLAVRLSDGTTRLLNGFWLNCLTGTGVFETIDATFRSKYVRTVNGRPSVSMTIVTPNVGGSNFNGACWYGSIYNYNVGGWEGKSTGCDTGGGSSLPAAASVFWYTNHYVWTGTCATFPGLRITDIFLFENGVAVPSTSYLSASAPIAPGACNSGGSYTFTYPAYSIHSSGNAFLASTPNP